MTERGRPARRASSAWLNPLRRWISRSSVAVGAVTYRMLANTLTAHRSRRYRSSSTHLLGGRHSAAARETRFRVSAVFRREDLGRPDAACRGDFGSGAGARIRRAGHEPRQRSGAIRCRILRPGGSSTVLQEGRLPGFPTPVRRLGRLLGPVQALSRPTKAATCRARGLLLVPGNSRQTRTRLRRREWRSRARSTSNRKRPKPLGRTRNEGSPVRIRASASHPRAKSACKCQLQALGSYCLECRGD
jgi:hypothetical protein